MGTYHSPGAVVALSEDADRAAPQLPEHVVVALQELVGACKEGLLALAVGTGLQVMHTLFEEDVTALAGPKGKHNPERTAVRHGSEAGSVALGGRRVAVTRPRVRSADGNEELPVPAYDAFAGHDQLSRMALERMLAGLSTRRYATGLEPVGSAVEQQASGTSRSAVSRRFVQLTRTALEELMAAGWTISTSSSCCSTAFTSLITSAWSPWPSMLTATSILWAWSRAPPRTAPWSRGCSRIWLPAVSTPATAYWWSSTAARRCGLR